MRRILTVVGARPQFVKMAFVSRHWPAGVQETIVNTGQHYDPGLSQVFFDELGIPAPKHHLAVGSGSHAQQTAKTMEGVEKILQDDRHDAVLVYGDTNATVAGGLVAAKLHIPVIHIEAGLRSWDRAMPEEVNRVVVDHLSSVLFAPTETARRNLANEGIVDGVEVVGDVMLDSTQSSWNAGNDAVLDRFGVKAKQFVLATVHRAENTDDPRRLDAIFKGLRDSGQTVILPIHPRTRNALAKRGQLDSLLQEPWLRLVEPIGHGEMIRLTGRAKVVATDSGGLQKEAVILGTPCVTMRDTTEWVETLEAKWNVLVGADAQQISSAIRSARAPANDGAALYGGAGVGERIAKRIAEVELRLPGRPMGR